ncbi:capsule biosynthesis protein [Roseovarius nanhaiticus]|uniref:Capsular polysaccharide transport system permease protein n=1 Tax=Roseovarius nanhaiticus TaxID=573024 RepID=A0A1N7FEN2_9RHOB|nr:capsule biosynthesis protein [Roseovarius nanhaiticus]SEK56240.1 capsular polysaccharide transport system permease protein [Roseovarius nanhaiticus]SIR98782.1 capsular polysaccharide transport system permease protein [Roseovarius nanhaiticus]
MTTKPKARKFRIRRTPLSEEGGPYPSEASTSEATEPRATSPDTAPREGQVSSPREEGSAQTIDEIRREGLTGRQLRMARRVAQKHALAPTSDFDAVRLLRQRGIDPFQRSSILELVANDQNDGDIGDLVPAKGRALEAQQRVQLPQTMPAQTTLPSTHLSPAERRGEEIMRIQKDIGKRRRRKLLLLLTRLAAFVFLPTLLAGYYYYAVATPMYSTKSEFLILSNDGGGGGGGMGGFKLPSQFATGQDAIATQSYLLSKDAMLRLDRDVGFREHFSQEWIDPIQRLDPDASNEEAYKLYKKYMKIGYDPTEGVLRMEISTADPEVSAEFSRKLIDYAEERVDDLSKRKREDALASSTESLEKAKEDRREAQRQLVAMQEGTVLDPEGEIANIRQLIGNVELQLQEKQLALNTQLNNARPNQARVEAMTSEIEVLQRELDKQRARLTDATEDNASLASQTADIQMAQADLLTADMVLQGALEAQRMSSSEANKQVRYLTVSVRPVASQDASYPRSFENTILAFLVFAGIYLMISLTASILREQVSS